MFASCTMKPVMRCMCGTHTDGSISCSGPDRYMCNSERPCLMAPMISDGVNEIGSFTAGAASAIFFEPHDIEITPRPPTAGLNASTLELDINKLHCHREIAHAA